MRHFLHSAYVAGLVDGEGYVGITKHRKASGIHGAFHICQLKISNNSRGILDKLKEEYGGSVSQNKNRPRHIQNLRDNWQYMITSRQCVRLLREILPFLQIKREQAELAIQFMQIPIKKGYPTTHEVWTTREQYRERVMQLNSRYNGRNDPR